MRNNWLTGKPIIFLGNLYFTCEPLTRILPLNSRRLITDLQLFHQALQTTTQIFSPTTTQIWCWEYPVTPCVVIQISFDAFIWKSKSVCRITLSRITTTVNKVYDLIDLNRWFNRIYNDERFFKMILFSRWSKD